LFLALLLIWAAIEAAKQNHLTGLWRTSYQYEPVSLEALTCSFSKSNGYHIELVASAPTRSRYPARLMDEYRALIQKKFQRALTAEDATRLQIVREEINAIDRHRPRPDTWDVQHQKLQEELAQIRAEAEALPKS